MVHLIRIDQDAKNGMLKAGTKKQMGLILSVLHLSVQFYKVRATASLKRGACSRRLSDCLLGDMAGYQIKLTVHTSCYCALDLLFIMCCRHFGALAFGALVIFRSYCKNLILALQFCHSRPGVHFIKVFAPALKRWEVTLHAWREK